MIYGLRYYYLYDNGEYILMYSIGFEDEDDYEIRWDL